MKINFFDTENLKRNHQAMIKGAALSACALTFAAFVASNIFTAVKLFKNDGANKYINLLSKISIVNTAIFACGALTSIFTCCALYLDGKIHLDKDSNYKYNKEILHEINDASSLSLIHI